MATRVGFIAGAVTGSVASAAAVVIYYKGSIGGQRQPEGKPRSGREIEVAATKDKSGTASASALASKPEKDVPLASVLPANPNRLRKTASFVADFDASTRNPRWVLEVHA
eukprot:scaffold106_cov380-Prasinococcus_capsulatus_cf.AAC.40